MDFANILFGGPCNRFCPFCIGQQLPQRVRQSNLGLYPLIHQEDFAREVNRLGIRQVVFTGTVTDPLLYRHQERLLQWLRANIVEGASYSLHTNGGLALQQMDTVNLYDKMCISLPSFNPCTYERMMGSSRVPRLAQILQRAEIPVKVSCIVTHDNEAEIGPYLQQLGELGVKRVVLRALYGSRLPEQLASCLPPQEPSHYRGSAVYQWDGMEVTLWNFQESESTSLNLFSDGTLGTSYLLAETAGFTNGK